MYAIVDIETTGGYAASNDITEVAIVLHDGERVVQRYETLVRPLRAIPYFIQRLTGITDDMVAGAPGFEEVAPVIYNLLRDVVFVAHNVNFDYSFLKHHLSAAGYELDTPKICTVRLTRKVFPGLASYSLGNLCRHFGIGIENRHRAGGDADATALLFQHLLDNNALEQLKLTPKKKSAEFSLPPHLPREQVDQLPYTPGVYYFHDQKGKVIYVGKAKNLKYRVRSHFTHNGAGRQRQDFLRTIFSISFETCGTELMAFILESIEIKRLWPAYNYSQKRAEASFGLYLYEDRSGYHRLVIDKKKKNLAPIYTFNLLVEGHRLMRILIREFRLCPRLCYMQTDNSTCQGVLDATCLGACEQKEAVNNYNDRVAEALSHLEGQLPSFALVDNGQQAEQQSCILIEKGRFYGMGYVPADASVYDLDALKTYLTRYPENDYIRGLVYQHAERYPHKKRLFA
ncbi:MAG: exonuclease domain-containing protein [Candidatus Pseudobacter hemicellulosilyticus]|uniref:Exonuclease domain-containing protein n=1 Tax=Candidatus Pseudobacter hemicellulosilyticus TaxID=3121375 RepID=A0AAJ5WTF7_9BACT|nr:MAG: exonuclease domain-containing protein [Pseudobacter sp.]